MSRASVWWSVAPRGGPSATFPKQYGEENTLCIQLPLTSSQTRALGTLTRRLNYLQYQRKRANAYWIYWPNILVRLAYAFYSVAISRCSHAQTKTNNK